MNLHQLNRFALSQALAPKDLALDATAGNGYDTLFLATQVQNSGLVLAFDVQEQAICNTRLKLEEQNLLHQVSLIHDNHANLEKYLPETKNLGAAVFNLGWLPGSDKRLITNSQDSLKACTLSLQHLKKGGLLSIHCYSGHAGGQEETRLMLEFAEKLDPKLWQSLITITANKIKNKEYLILITHAEPRTFLSSNTAEYKDDSFKN